MRATLTWPELYTIALGAVAIGSINAQLQLIAAGTMSISGGYPIPIAAANKTGINKVAVAMLLVASVNNVTHKQRINNKLNTIKTPNISITINTEIKHGNHLVILV